MKTAKSAARKLCLFFLLIILAVLIGFFVYAGTYYHADPSAAEALESDDRVTVAKTEYGWMFDGPSEEDVLVFYPGAKVEETAYAPLLHLLAGRGIDVCMVKMPFRLAVVLLITSFLISIMCLGQALTQSPQPLHKSSLKVTFGINIPFQI